jgi:hypothetical protein
MVTLWVTIFDPEVFLHSLYMERKVSTPAVALYLRVRLASGRRIYAEPCYGVNNRLKANYALIGTHSTNRDSGVEFEGPLEFQVD